MEQTMGEKINEGLKVAKSMINYGGCFVAHLGQALLVADIYNTMKIKEAWPDYWKQYLSMSKKD